MQDDSTAIDTRLHVYNLCRFSHRRQTSRLLILIVLQVWRFTDTRPAAMVDTIVHTSFVSRDTRVHRAGIHALAAIIKSCWHSGKQKLLPAIIGFGVRPDQNAVT